MAQTRVTYDVSTGGKVKADGTTAMIRHWARDVDAENGIYRPHSNEGIDPSRSLNNMTYFPTDGPRDEWTTPGSTEEIEQRLQDRLATVTGRKRRDAVVMRGIVLGLSPDWVDEHTPNWKTDPADREKFMDTLQPVVDIVIKKAGGAKNVVLVTGHFDEVVPQIQIGVTPVTEDGRLRQNDFELFKSPSHLGSLHKKIRKELKETGVDVILESSERSREHLSNHEYARKADKEREQKIEQLAKEQAKLDKREAAVGALRQAALNEGFKQGYEDGEVEAGALYADVQQQRQAVEAERKQLDEDKAKLPELERAVAKKGYAAGHKKGYGDGQEQVGTLLADARQKANDIVAQAHAQVDAIRKQREELEKEHDKEKALLQETSDAVTAKYNELQQLRQEVEDAEAVKNSRENMKQLDSDFLDDILKYPKIHQRYEDFKKKRVKGFAAVVDGTQDYYERTVGENQQRQEQRANSRQRQQNQQQRGTQKPTQPGYTSYF